MANKGQFKPGDPRAGRRAGSANKATATARNAISSFIEGKAGGVEALWDQGSRKGPRKGARAICDPSTARMLAPISLGASPLSHGLFSHGSTGSSSVHVANVNYFFRWRHLFLPVFGSRLAVIPAVQSGRPKAGQKLCFAMASERATA
jgi:hypothetical protein